MPILIKRPDGEATPLLNGEYLSAYYFFPKELLIKCGHELSSISRVPSRAIYEKKSREVIEMAQVEGVTEQLKAGNQMLWLQKMMNIRNRVEEIIKEELIYS